MNEVWEPLEVLITVRTYPVPSRQSIEVSCTAGVTRDGKWVRLYPVPWRLLAEDKKFRKYEWVKVMVRHATSDSRDESRRLDEGTIQVLTDPLPTDQQWAARRRIVMPLKAQSMCWLQDERDRTMSPTLGFIKPREIRRLIIEPEKEPDWSEVDLARLRQTDMFRQAPKQELEKIPFRFSFNYFCEESTCRSHTMMCSDWELAGLYRKMRRRPDWQDRFQQRIQNLIERRDIHFYVGTVSDHPGSWIITGLWYPPREQQGVLEGLG